jgi:hypothetical protein
MVGANAYRSDGPWPPQIARSRRIIREQPIIARLVAGKDFELPRFGARTVGLGRRSRVPSALIGESGQ